MSRGRVGQFNEKYGEYTMYRIGIDLGGTNIAAGIVNENFEIICKASVPTGNSLFVIFFSSLSKFNLEANR